MAVNESLQLLITVFLLMCISVIGVNTIPAFQKVSDGGFDVMIEKTAQTTPMEVIPEEHIMKIDDIALVVLLLDDYSPDPQTIKLKWYNASGVFTGSNTFNVDTNFLNNRAETITNAILSVGGSLSPDHEVKYNLEVNSTGKVAWVFEIHN